MPKIEELGWRGVALPPMQRRFPSLWAALILGLLVAIWHTPSFLLSGTKQSTWDFWPFFLGVAAVVVIVLKRRTMLDRDHGVTATLLPSRMPENGGHDNSLGYPGIKPQRS